MDCHYLEKQIDVAFFYFWGKTFFLKKGKKENPFSSLTRSNEEVGFGNPVLLLLFFFFA